MNMLILFVFLIVNFGISFWNAYSCGAYLTESKLIGGWIRFIMWCGLIMSAVGFTWVYLTLITLLSVSTGWLTHEQGEVMFGLGYLILIIPLLGSGFGIWVHSLVVAYRQRSFGSVGIAGWNTFAQAHNTWRAVKDAPNVFKAVTKFFSGKGGKDKGGALIILLVILAFAGGIITTALIARWADKKVAVKFNN